MASMLVGSVAPGVSVQAVQETAGVETSVENGEEQNITQENGNNENQTQEGVGENSGTASSNPEDGNGNTGSDNQNGMDETPGLESNEQNEGENSDNNQNSNASENGSDGTNSENANQSETQTNVFVVSPLNPATAKVVVLDPGHCNRHGGARGYGLKEEVVNLDIGLACREALERYGDVTVYMTRETGGCCEALDMGGCLISRNNYAKSLQADFLVSMHINAGSTRSGANILVPYKSGYRDEIRRQTWNFGYKALASLRAIGVKDRGFLLRKAYVSKYPNKRRADYYSIVHNGVEQNIPSVIIEHGFITNRSDCKKFFATKAKRKVVGNADANAIIQYFGLSVPVVTGSLTQEADGNTYFVNSQKQKISGWVKTGGKWYYFDLKTGALRKGWLTLDGNTFYLNPATGEMVVGWFFVDGAKYLARGNGTIVADRIESDGMNSYLFGVDGKVRGTGFYVRNNQTYYVDGSLRLAKGFVKVGQDKYYFDKTSHTMVTGWKKIGKYYYYFSEMDGKMQKNKKIGKYYVNKKGQRKKKK